MMSISSSQYVWTLFVKPLQSSLDTNLAAVQVTFSIFVVLQTWLSPLQGVLIQKFGPRLLISAGAILTGGSWVLAAAAHDLAGLYLSYGVMGGLGTGIIYVGIVGLMVQWFPDKRGLATGLVAAGYGFGAILTTFPIASMIKSAGYAHALTVFGIILGLVGLVVAQGLRRAPKSSELPASVINASSPAISQSTRHYTSKEMLKTPVFWLLFVMMAMMSTGGLMVISQMGAFAKDFGVSDVLVFGLAALPLALSIDRFTNGLTRPFFGWVSDHIGRENTMAVAFMLEAIAIVMMLAFRENALAFVLLSGVVFFGWGEIFSLFPSTLTDIFGTGNATTNYGFLYMAQGVGAILGAPVAALLHEAAHSWVPIFGIVTVMDVATALLAFFVLKSWRKRMVTAEHAEMAPALA
ncbi:putative oxalate/formate antiporter [Sulfuriferula multivorans]|uniref:Putative oxalate/formate antiporter n=2 Tax=Sulfuriferula multivorans TaxID=1559896 RepID=A0A401JG43_9PROT|nr:putative oxalate/formate antiporter [Sulfuriferula multivorans]